MECPGCQAQNREGAQFCRECGTRLDSVCPACRAALKPGSKFCDTCGATLPAPTPATSPPYFASPGSYTPRHLAEKILTSRSALEGERKQVTVLFCDLANSTALAERLGPDVMHGLLNQFFELALAEVHRYEGTINQFLGDGFMALFGAPLTHEDHARRAALAALAIQRSLKEQRAALGSRYGLELAVRIGLNTGPVVVGRIGDNLRMDYTAIGDTTNLAARLQQLAEPTTVYLSENTNRAVREYFECRLVGTRKVKGKVEPVTVYTLLGVRTQPEQAREAAGISSPLVGREREYGALMGAIEGLRLGRGGMVSIIGEAGLGKSRLVAEARRQAGVSDLLWLEGRALSFSRTISYWPFLEIIRSYAGINENDREGEAWAKLERRVTGLFRDQAAEVLPYLATLLGFQVPGELEVRVKYLDARAMGRQILLTTRRFFARLPREERVVLVFQDLHWIDQSSAELLEHLLPLVEIAPILILDVGRPDPQTATTRLRQMATQQYANHYTEIVLSPLSPAESVRLTQHLLKIDDLPVRVQEVILGKAEGNPFFIEEVIRALIAMGAIVRDRTTDQWKATARMDQISVPDTIQGVIMARVDRLDEDLKQVLKLASVIGRSFFYRVLRTIAEAERELDRHLAELQHVEFIRERRRIPELEYIFKHALVQETTYESILLDRRWLLHRQVGECIEVLFADRLEEFYGLLAYHYAHAGNPRKAHEFLLKAGDQAGKVAADAEALAHYRQALALYERLFGDRWDPLERAALERKIGEAFFRRGNHQEAMEYQRRALSYLGHPYPGSRTGIRLAIARQLVQQVGHRLFPGLFLRNKGSRADPVAEERISVYEVNAWIDYWADEERFVLDVLLALNLAERSALSPRVVQGFTGAGLICDLIGVFGLAGHYHGRAAALAEQIRHPLAMGTAYLGLGLHEDYRGVWNAALGRYQRAAEIYREAGDIRRWGATTSIMAHLHSMRGEFGQGLKQIQEVVRVGRDGADPEVAGWGLLMAGILEFGAGLTDEAITHLQEALELLKAVPDYQSVAMASGHLGQCYLRQEKLREALAIVEEANRLIAERGLRGHYITCPRNALADAYLSAAVEAEGAQRDRALGKAKRACRLALKQGRIFRGGLPHALRAQGTYEWVRGKPAKAQKWWLRSLAVAEELGARYDLGMTHLEMGKRMGTQVNLEQAEAIFAEIGAAADLTHA